MQCDSVEKRAQDRLDLMEAGLIMPEPGAEAAWFEANKAILGEMQTAA